MSQLVPPPPRLPFFRRLAPFGGAVALSAAMLGAPLSAADLPPGLAQAELLGGAVQPDGSVMAALRLQLEPGWKTYWRSPGDSGIAPSFDWSESDNLGKAEPIWPRPEVIDSEGERTLGYHDELVLPLRITPADTGKPVALRAAIDFGLCRDVCVPAHLRLDGPAAATPPDARIDAALTLVPPVAKEKPSCTISDIDDGVRVTARLPAAEQINPAPALADANAVAEATPIPANPEAAMELDQPGVWVSSATLDGDTATADFVAPSGKPFPLDTSALRVTVIAPDGAVEYQGCAG